MNLRNYLGLIAILLFCTACPNDDDGPIVQPLADRGEQSLEDDDVIKEYLQTHFYNYEEFENPDTDFDYKIVFDTIAGDNSDKEPLWERDELIPITYDRFETSNTLYVLKVREGVGEAATYADSTFVTYSGRNLGGDIFDNAENPIWFNLPSTIDGFARGIAGSKGASGFTTNPDGTTNFNNDYAIGAIFIPSGLAYFASPPNSSIGLYSSLIFEYEMYDRIETDHDGDGIPSLLEDVNNNQFFFDDEDNTDGDAVGDFRDEDDDNDGVVTSLEITFVPTTITNDEGVEEIIQVLQLLDTDGDEIPDHRDEDDDGDGINTVDEINVNFNTGVITYPDTDGNGIPDYLDPDS